MSMQPLSNAELLRLEQANYRRVTFLTTWTLVMLYVLCDMLFRWAMSNQVEVLLRIDYQIPSNPVWFSLLFIASAIGIWILFYALDDGFELAGPRSLCYQLGDMTHLRPFNIFYLSLLLITMAVALYEQVDDISFWLLGVLLLISSVVNLIEFDGQMRERLRRYAMRLRLLFHRLPLVGRYVSLAPINAAQAPEPDALTPPDPPAEPLEAAPDQPAPHS